MTDLKEKVSEFLFEEADICDRHAYGDWLKLWAKDGTYWLPCNDDDASPETHVALIYEKYTALEDRVRRLSSGFSHTQDPKSRLARVLSNIRVKALPDGLVEARSVVNIASYRRHEKEVFAGRVVHVLRPVGDSFEMVSKTVYLIDNDGYMHNMTFLI